MKFVAFLLYCSISFPAAWGGFLRVWQTARRVSGKYVSCKIAKLADYCTSLRY